MNTINAAVIILSAVETLILLKLIFKSDETMVPSTLELKVMGWERRYAR